MTLTFSKVTPLLLLLGGSFVLEACSESDSGPSNAAGASGRVGSAGDEAGAPSSAGSGNEAGSSSDAGSAGAEIGAGGAAGSAGDAGSAGAAGAPEGNGGSSGTLGTGGSGGAPSGKLMIPCSINAVYVSVCQNCHSEPPLNDAPFALVTLADMQATAPAQYGAISAGSMPKAGSLTPTEKDLLMDWLLDGAPGVPEASCP